MRVWLLALGSLLVWATWFMAAYGLHGVQCSVAAPGMTGARGQAWQIALWLIAIGVCAALIRQSRRDDFAGNAVLARAAVWLNVIGGVAVAFTGAVVLLIAPC